MSKLEIVRIYADKTDERVIDALLQLAINGMPSYEKKRRKDKSIPHELISDCDKELRTKVKED